MKRAAIILVFVLAVILSLSACGNSSDASVVSANENPVIKIGIISPSDEETAAGSEELTGIEYANSICSELELDGKVYDVELSDNLTGAAAIISLCGTAETAEKIKDIKDTAVVSPTCTEDDFAGISDSCFAVSFTDSFQAKTLAGFADERIGAQTACCLAEKGNDASVKLCEDFIEAFKEVGGNIIYETVDKGGKLCESVVANAVKSSADVFFVPVSAETGAALIEEAAKQKYLRPILSGTSWDNSMISETAHGRQVEVFITAFYMEGQNLDFDEGYRAWLISNQNMAEKTGENTELSSRAVKGYDAYFAIIEAIKAAGSDKAAEIKEALPKVSFKGVCSEVAFGTDRNAKNTLAYMKKCDIEEGGWDFVRKSFTDPVQPAENKEPTAAAEGTDKGGN